MRGIISHGAYLPYRRLDRTTIAAVSGTGGGKGSRTVASYDEDTTTLAVEAARRALRATAALLEADDAAKDGAKNTVLRLADQRAVRQDPAAAKLLAQWPDDGADLESLRAEARNRITEALASLPGGDDGLVLEACYAAEAFLSTWQDELPFGRPI